jgi:hypothetical protein
MTSSTHITLRRTGLVLATAVLGAVLAGSALAGNGSGLNLPPQAAIKASSDNWAAKAKLLDVNGQPRISLFVPNAAIDAASANWAAKAKLLDVSGQPRISLFVPNAAIDAASANWAAKAKLLDINGRPVHQTPVTSGGSSSFDWADFGIGAGAMLGVLLLATGLLAGAHYGRKSGVRPRPTS